MSARHSTSKTALVYFIQSGDSGPIKIGRTSGNPLRRLDELQTATSEHLRILAVASDSGETGELNLHARFRHLRIKREWFEPSDELLEFIDKHASPFVPSPRKHRKPASPWPDKSVISALRNQKLASENEPGVTPKSDCDEKQEEFIRIQRIAIAALLDAGLTVSQIQEQLQISRSTYFRRQAELRRIQSEATRLMKAEA